MKRKLPERWSCRRQSKEGATSEYLSRFLICSTSAASIWVLGLWFDRSSNMHRHLLFIYLFIFISLCRVGCFARTVPRFASIAAFVLPPKSTLYSLWRWAFRAFAQKWIGDKRIVTETALALHVLPVNVKDLASKWHRWKTDSIFF